MTQLDVTIQILLFLTAYERQSDLRQNVYVSDIASSMGDYGWSGEDALSMIEKLNGSLFSVSNGYVTPGPRMDELRAFVQPLNGFVGEICCD